MQFSTWWFKTRADFCIESSVVAIAVKPFFQVEFETICKSVFPLQNAFECRVNKHDGWTESRPGRTGRAAAGPARLRSPSVGNPVCGASSLSPPTRGVKHGLGSEIRVFHPRPVPAEAPRGAAPRPYLRGQPAVPERPVRAACGAPQLALPVEHPVPQRAPVLGAHRQRVVAESFHPGRDGEGGRWQFHAPGSQQPPAILPCPHGPCAMPATPLPSLSDPRSHVFPANPAVPSIFPCSPPPLPGSPQPLCPFPVPQCPPLCPATPAAHDSPQVPIPHQLHGGPDGASRSPGQRSRPAPPRPRPRGRACAVRGGR